jgi:hypothetical protein
VGFKLKPSGVAHWSEPNPIPESLVCGLDVAFRVDVNIGSHSQREQELGTDSIACVGWRRPQL